MIRLDKFLAEAGVGTRTEVKKLIKAKKVVVDGTIVIRPEQKVNSTDVVNVAGKKLITRNILIICFINQPDV